MPDGQDYGQNIAQVIDGGFLLHRVVWPRDTSFENICQSYVTYLRHHFPNYVEVVFDGYPDDPSQVGTKFAERHRRTHVSQSPDIIFDQTTNFSGKKDKFLSNDNNKKRFLTILQNY